MPIRINDLHRELPYTSEQIRRAFYAVFRNSPSGRIVYEVLLKDWVLTPKDGERGLGYVDAFSYINGMIAEYDALHAQNGGTDG